VQAHLDLEARQSIAMHFGTFQLTPEGIDEPARDLAAALAERDIPPEKFRVLESGESFRVST
jgi:L-ascorbate metabolism protein UlaG (beta-lactamase superfamily)